MLIYPAIDLYEQCAVRLVRGDYQQKTVYSTDPVSVALDFKAQGAVRMHMVDLEGARFGTCPNFDMVCRVKQESQLFVEIGGGIRDMDTVSKYLDAGIDRVILGTAAVSHPEFVQETVSRYGEQIAVGVDIKDGYVAIKGWTETADVSASEFFSQMQDIGVQTIICTDISKDGMMMGPNKHLYEELSVQYPNVDLIASGGVSSMEDIRNLKALGIHGAILGKAYYTKAVDLKEAIIEAGL